MYNNAYLKRYFQIDLSKKIFSTVFSLKILKPMWLTEIIMLADIYQISILSSFVTYDSCS